MIRRSASKALVLAVLCLPVMPASAREYERPDPDAALTRAVVAHGRLWLRARSGVVFSVGEGMFLRRREAIEALDLCVHDGKLIAVSTADQKAGWSISRYEDGAWRITAHHAALAGETLASLACGAGGPFLVTSKRVVGPGGASALGAHERIEHLPRVAAALVQNRRLFLGLDAGEWGGGLRRIALASGAVTNLEKKDQGDICFGPLDSRCDPVNALAPAPWRPACLVAAIGLVHMLSHGRLVEICGDEIRTLVTCPLEVVGATYVSSPCVREAASLPPRSVPFAALVRVGDHLVAFDTAGTPYTVTAEGAQRGEEPVFIDVDGVALSWSVPGAVLVRTIIGAENRVGTVGVLAAPR